MAHLYSCGLFRGSNVLIELIATETAVLKVLSDILLAIDDGDMSALVLLNLSAAFETVDHYNIPFRRLSITYRLNLNGTVLNWFESYLVGTRQQVLCIYLFETSRDCSELIKIKTMRYKHMHDSIVITEYETTYATPPLAYNFTHEIT